MANKTINELIASKNEKDKAIFELSQCNSDNILLIYYEEIKYRPENENKLMTKEEFINYCNAIKYEVRKKENVVKKFCNTFTDTYLIDENTYQIAESVMNLLLCTYFDCTEEAAEEEINYMLEYDWFEKDKDNGVISYNGVRYELSDFSVWYDALEAMYGRCE